MAKSDQQVVEEFDEAVTWAPKSSRSSSRPKSQRRSARRTVGGESKGHESGRKIVEILGKNNSDYTEADIEHMRRVVSYVHRHQAQRPKGDVEGSNWHYSLMNWGHDPLK
jgi:Protein of unknown function (DUF3140)